MAPFTPADSSRRQHKRRSRLCSPTLISTALTRTQCAPSTRKSRCDFELNGCAMAEILCFAAFNFFKTRRSSSTLSSRFARFASACSRATFASPFQRPASVALRITNVRFPAVPQPERVANVDELRTEYMRRGYTTPAPFGLAASEIELHVELRPCDGLEHLIGPQRSTLRQNVWLRYRGASSMFAALEIILLAYKRLKRATMRVTRASFSRISPTSAFRLRAA